MELRLTQGWLHRPTVCLHAIAGYDGAGAVTTVLAMQVDRTWQRAQQSEDLLDLLIGGRVQARKRDVGVGDAADARLARFVVVNLPRHAEINDGADAQSLQGIEGRAIRFGAAIKTSVHAAIIHDALARWLAALAGGQGGQAEEQAKQTAERR